MARARSRGPERIAVGRAERSRVEVESSGGWDDGPVVVGATLVVALWVISRRLFCSAALARLRTRGAGGDGEAVAADDEGGEEVEARGARREEDGVARAGEPDRGRNRRSEVGAAVGDDGGRAAAGRDRRDERRARRPDADDRAGPRADRVEQRPLVHVLALP